MGHTDEAWNEVGEQFKSLGLSLKRLYESAGEPKAEDPPSDEEMKDAFKTIGDGITHAFSAVGDAVGDPEIRAETRQTAASFFDALGTTFSEVGEDIVSRSDSPPADADLPTTPPPDHNSDESER